jgi:hypothetical protein
MQLRDLRILGPVWIDALCLCQRNEILRKLGLDLCFLRVPFALVGSGNITDFRYKSMSGTKVSREFGPAGQG